jgi:hypothetical protein
MTLKIAVINQSSIFVVDFHYFSSQLRHRNQEAMEQYGRQPRSSAICSISAAVGR